MKALHQLEKMVRPWFKDLPHLPKEATKWMATNAWWLTLVGVVVAVLMMMALMPLLFGASVVMGVYGGTYASGYAAYTGLAVASAWLSLLFFAAIVVIEAMAISHLKGGKKKGWDLLFLALVVSVVQSLVSAVLLVSVSKLLGAAIGAAIGGYILFEIQDHFKR